MRIIEEHVRQVYESTIINHLLPFWILDMNLLFNRVALCSKGVRSTGTCVAMHCQSSSGSQGVTLMKLEGFLLWTLSFHMLRTCHSQKLGVNISS